MVALVFHLFIQQICDCIMLCTRHLAGLWRNISAQDRNVPSKRGANSIRKGNQQIISEVLAQLQF